MSQAGDSQIESDARLSDDPEALRAFANHDDPAVRRAVASNAHTPDDLLHVLTSDEDTDVRIATAGNPSTPLGPLRLMVNSREPTVALAASRALDERLGHVEEDDSPTDASPDVDQGATGEPSPPSTDPAEGKPAGWYPDPSGVHEHLAYWDGEKWTDATANPSGPPQKKANVGRIILFVALGFIGLLILSVVVVSLGGEELSETLTEIQEGLDNGGSSQGESANLDLVTYIDESLGYEMKYDSKWQILDDSGFAGTSFSLATPEQIAEVFEGEEASTSPIVLFGIARPEPGFAPNAKVFVSRDDRTVEELTADLPRISGYQEHRVDDLGGQRELVAFYDRGDGKPILRLYVLADGVLWSVVCVTNRESAYFMFDAETCATILATFEIPDM